MCICWNCVYESQIEAVWAPRGAKTCPSRDVDKHPEIFMCSLALNIVVVCLLVFVLRRNSLCV
jgi:hypothetical protein